jgi:hypothetical protein
VEDLVKGDAPVDIQKREGKQKRPERRCFSKMTVPEMAIDNRMPAKGMIVQTARDWPMGCTAAVPEAQQAPVPAPRSSAFARNE